MPSMRSRRTGACGCDRGTRNRPQPDPGSRAHLSDDSIRSGRVNRHTDSVADPELDKAACPGARCRDARRGERLIRCLLRAAAAVLACATPVMAQTAANVAVIINDGSPASQRVGGPTSASAAYPRPTSFTSARPTATRSSVRRT